MDTRFNTTNRTITDNMDCASQNWKRKFTNENDTFVRLGLALHTAEELGHEIHRRYILQIRRRWHFLTGVLSPSLGKMGDGREVEGGSVCWRFFAWVFAFLVVEKYVYQILAGVPCIKVLIISWHFHNFLTISFITLFFVNKFIFP